MDNVYVKPAVDAVGDAIVARHPGRGWSRLPPEGGWWPRDAYTTRRLRDEDVTEAEPPPEIPPEFAAPKPARPRRPRRPAAAALPPPSPAPEPAALPET
jgi:hypothetical protein